MPLLDRADFADTDMLRVIQQDNWTRQRAYVMAHSPFLRDVWRAREPPSALEALVELPFTDKAMLRADQAAHPPFGSYLAAGDTAVARVHRTSGTSGQAMNLALSRNDARITAVVGGRAQSAAGLGPGHRVVHCLNYQMWMGGLTDHMTLEETGATVIPFGTGDSRLLIETIRQLKVTAISCTPSYPAVLERVIAEHFPQLSPRDLGLKLALFGGEAGLDDVAFRRRLEQVWGFAPRNANYGVSDVFCNFAGQCEQQNDLHFVAADMLYPELIDPDTGAPRPIAEGEKGELVLTHLDRACQPLVRFRCGDVLTVTGTGACACGRTGFRFRVIGRSDDMVVVRGINVFPTMVAAVLGGFAELSGEYCIRLKGGGPLHRLPVEVELAAGRHATPELAARVCDAIKRDVRVTAEVAFAAFGDLPRTAGKTRRVIRED